MANVTYPGVYIEEVSSGVRPIQAAGTSTAAFIGAAEKGPIGRPVKIFSFTEYQNLFGGFLEGDYLGHSVFQFFNNGGAECYIVRVSGENAEIANIILNDRGVTPQPSITIFAESPGVWGNKLAVVVSDGANDPGNEFDISVFWEDQVAPLERFKNLSMTPTAANFVEAVTASSKYIRVLVNQLNTNVGKGTSRGSGNPSLPLEGTEKTKLRININSDGYQEVNLKDAIGSGEGQVANLNTADSVASAIQYVVSRLQKLRASSSQEAFKNFACTVHGGALLLTSGVESTISSVTVAPATNDAQDATGLLKLGKLRGGTETSGAAVTRPRNNPTTGTPPEIIFFFVGDDSKGSSGGVASVHAGTAGDAILTDQPYLDVFGSGILNDKTDVSLIAVPGIGSPAVVGAGMNYCANRSLSDCFFIGDMKKQDESVDDAVDFRTDITPKNSYGAVYLPWLKMVDPTGKSSEPILVPPSGFVAGLYAKTDAQRGVWKAPAGTSVAVGGAVGLAGNFTDAQQGNLNPLNINVIRKFPGSGIVLWGARTVTADPEWNYIPVRRMAIMLRVSIYNGIQWAVFEPNDEDLWAQLRLNIGSFMMGLFRKGAFQGSTPSEAFFVKCDKETTTQVDINEGVVNVLVGFAPLKPAEFVVVKISQKAGQTS